MNAAQAFAYCHARGVQNDRRFVNVQAYAPETGEEDTDDTDIPRHSHRQVVDDPTEPCDASNATQWYDRKLP